METSLGASESARQPEADGVQGNARLTGSAAALLLLLLAAEGATLPAIHALLRPHVFIGFALIPPVALKLASTIYRFARYYTGAQSYRLKGPPPTALRILGPVLILATVALLATGVGLVFVTGSWQQRILTLHKASFILWFATMTLHVLSHLVDTVRLAPRDWTPHSRTRTSARPLPGTRTRRWALASSVLAGALLGAWSLGHLGLWGGRS